MRIYLKLLTKNVNDNNIIIDFIQYKKILVSLPKQSNFRRTMNLYKVDLEYYNFLHYYEPKIPYVKNEKQNRPFIGIVLDVNGKNYFAPLTSPKPKHITLKDMQDFLKIDSR